VLRSNLLGFDSDYYRTYYDQLDSDQIVARVIEQQKNSFRLKAIHSPTATEWWGAPSGRLLREARDAAQLPVIGDFVVTAPGTENDRVQIFAVLPRKTLLVRRSVHSEHEPQPLAANVDHVFVVTSLNQDFNLNRLHRYQTIIKQSGAEGSVLLTKADLENDSNRLARILETVQTILPARILSSYSGVGIDEFAQSLAPNKSHIFVGSSGVGKSTLINRLLGEERLVTRSIREYDGRGRHATTFRSLTLLASGAIVIDSPGIRELSLWDIDDGDLEDTFKDIGQLAHSCKYRNCAHESEPGCAVQQAIEVGLLEASRLKSYRKLQKEMRFYERQEDKKAQLKEKERWKTISKAAKKIAKIKRHYPE
jgi:ribosome biogenesis GTPase